MSVLLFYLTASGHWKHQVDNRDRVDCNESRVRELTPGKQKEVCRIEIDHGCAEVKLESPSCCVCRVIFAPTTCRFRAAAIVKQTAKNISFIFFSNLPRSSNVSLIEIHLCCVYLISIIFFEFTGNMTMKIFWPRYCFLKDLAKV